MLGIWDLFSEEKWAQANLPRKDTNFSISFNTCSCVQYIKKAVPTITWFFVDSLPPPKGHYKILENTKGGRRTQTWLQARTEKLTQRGRKPANKLKCINTHHTIFKPSTEIQQCAKNIMITLISNQKIMEKIFPLLGIWDHEKPRWNLGLYKCLGTLMSHSRWFLVL